MLSQHRRPNHLEIDSDSVTGRAAALRRRVGPRVKIFAALKADGYGFGTLPMAHAALAGGADALSLIDRAEAIELRQAGIDAPILLYAGVPIDADAVAAAERFRLILTVLSAQQIDVVARHARTPVELAIKLEVGPERIGVLPEQLIGMADRIGQVRGLSLAIVNAHPTFGDDAPESVLQEQFRRFVAALDQLRAIWCGDAVAPVCLVEDAGSSVRDGTRCDRPRPVSVQRQHGTADYPVAANDTDPGASGDPRLRAGARAVRHRQGAACRRGSVRSGRWRRPLSRRRGAGTRPASVRLIPRPAGAD